MYITTVFNFCIVMKKENLSYLVKNHPPKKTLISFGDEYQSKKTHDYLIYCANLLQLWLLHLGQTNRVISNPFVSSSGSIKIASQFLQWYINLIYITHLFYYSITYYIIIFYNLIFLLFFSKLWVLHLKQTNIVLFNKLVIFGETIKNELQALQRYINIIEFCLLLCFYIKDNYNYLFIIFYYRINEQEIFRTKKNK